MAYLTVAKHNRFFAAKFPGYIANRLNFCCLLPAGWEKTRIYDILSYLAFILSKINKGK